MIVDASVIIPWLNGADQPECAVFEDALRFQSARLAPITVTELLADRATATGLVLEVLTKMRRVVLLDGYWERAGRSRSTLLRAGRRARTPDTLLAQACIDADLPLLTRDGDFHAFAELAGLKLA